MLVKTRGVVIRYIKYGETSIIINIYTESFGMQSYIANNIRSVKAKSTPALFQPLSLLELEVYHKKTAEINRLSSWKTAEHLSSIYTNIKKATIALFLSEVLYRSIKETEPHDGLFEFIYQSVHIFDTMESRYENFHLQFLLKLLKYVGFGIHEGHNSSIPGFESDAFTTLLKSTYDSEIKLTNEFRGRLLDGIILYYQEHVDGFGKIKSLKVLREVFSF